MGEAPERSGRIVEMRRLSFALAAPTLFFALCACAEPDPAPAAPRWVALARGFQPRPLEELAQRLEARVQPSRAGRIVRRGDGEVWFELPLAREGWTTDAERVVWRTPLPAGGALLTENQSSAVVVDGERVLEEGLGRRERPQRFELRGSELLLTVPEGAEPAETLLYRVRLEHGRKVDGTWRAAQRSLVCDGVLVFPGEPERLTVEVPPTSVLSFASVSPDPGGRGEELGPTTFRVRLDGRAIFEREQVFSRPLGAEWHRVELDASGAHEFTFEIEGPAPALFATPVLTPVEIGRSGKRPFADARPDLVLVLCDTFRADNLAAWGGAPELAPHLNRFVEGSLHFLDARSTAAWTLPSIATMLSGLQPGQHGATDLDRGVADEVETIAEVLARAGYRTVALTDAGFFSRHYGQDQGFQWFEETEPADWSLADSLARARAHRSADDGRPLFLVLHTYRVHGPLRVGPEEDIRPFRRLQAEIARRLEERRAAGKFDKMSVALEFVDEGLPFYADAVRDLDRKVGAWLEELQREGFFERGRLVLTADHGNAHGEHDQVGHGGDLYDVKLRVPLAIAGKEILPRAVPGVVSLIDLAPTLAALAGVDPSPTWIGRSLLASVGTEPIYAFDFKKRDRQFALYAEGKKLMARDLEALRAGRLSHAYDLALDPREDHDLAGDPTWPTELGRRLAATLEPLLVPASEAQVLELSPEIQEQLQAIGYGE